MPRCEHFAKHGVRHGTDTEPVCRRCQHEGDEQSSLRARLSRQLVDRGHDGADAEERGGHGGGESDKLRNSIHPSKGKELMRNSRISIHLAIMGLHSYIKACISVLGRGLTEFKQIIWFQLGHLSSPIRYAI